MIIVFNFQYERHVEKEKAAEATKTIDSEWKELQMLMSAVKVSDCTQCLPVCLPVH